jgi:hypothetical protein
MFSLLLTHRILQGDNAID